MFSFVTGDGLGSVDTGAGHPQIFKGMKFNPKKIHHSKIRLSKKSNLSTTIKTGIFILTVLIYYNILGNLFSPVPDPLAPEEGEEETTALGEEEAMRILEQQNDDDDDATPSEANGDSQAGGRGGGAGPTQGGEAIPCWIA